MTGGAGFIGSHLVGALTARGDHVRVIDDLSTGRLSNLNDVPGVELVEADLLTASLEQALRDVDTVYHLAAVPSVPRSVAEPMRSHEAAATATLRLLIAARSAGVKRLVNSSSSSVYGNAERPPMKESMPLSPRSPYAVAKLAAEGYTRVFASLYGMSTVSLRYFNVFGPRQDPGSPYAAAIPRFISAYLARSAPVVYGDGRQSRDFTYVDNVVQANLLAGAAEGLRGESVNIASGRPYSVLEVLELISSLLGTRVEPVHAPERPGDIRDSHADIGLARRLLGYEATITLPDGLTRTLEWMRSTVA